MNKIKQPRICVATGFELENDYLIPTYEELPVTVKDFNLGEGWAIVQFEDGNIDQIELDYVIDFPFHPESDRNNLEITDNG